MANTITVTNRTIEISGIDSDYMMDQVINVQSVVFIPGISLKTPNYVNIIENSLHTTNPVKIKLINLVGGKEARACIFNQRLQLGFVFANCNLDAWCKVIFNIGEIKFGNDVITTQMKMKLSAEDIVL